jgi:molecular chaperone GrpE
MEKEEEIKEQTPPPVEATEIKQPDDLQKQLDEMKEKYLRTLADGENARKRLAKERQEILSYGIENAISEFLPAIDNFENAMRFAESESSEVKNWAVGFEMILGQFKQVLNDHGIFAFHSEGTMFDPNCHDAVEILETTEALEGTILHEFTKGYKSASRTIRPARVKVARVPQKKETDPADLPAETIQTKN